MRDWQLLKIWCSAVLAAVFFLQAPAFAQMKPASKESHKYRNIGVLAGLGAGVLVGQIVAWSNEPSKDDLPEVLTVMAVSAAGLAVAGYFIGKRADKKASASQQSWKRQTAALQAEYAAAFRPPPGDRSMGLKGPSDDKNHRSAAVDSGLSELEESALGKGMP